MALALLTTLYGALLANGVALQLQVNEGSERSGANRDIILEGVPSSKLVEILEFCRYAEFISDSSQVQQLAVNAGK